MFYYYFSNNVALLRLQKSNYVFVSCTCKLDGGIISEYYKKHSKSIATNMMFSVFLD